MPRVSQECIDAAKDAMHLFTEDELRTYVHQVLNRSQEYQDLGGVGAIKKAIEDVNKEKLQEMLEDAKVVSNDAEKTQRLAVKIQKGLANLRDTLVRRVRGLSDNIESAQRAATEQMNHGMFDEMDADDMLFVQDRNNNQEIANAYDGLEASPRAQKIAGLIKKYIDFRNTRLVLSDAMSILHINTDRYFKAMHDPAAIMRGGRSTIKAAWSKEKYSINSSKQLWKDEIKKRLDMKETFGETDAMREDGTVNEEQVDKILDNIYDNITTGKSEIFTKSIARNDKEAVARKSRMFFKWKDMRSQLTYNAKYGRGDLFGLINGDIHMAGNKIGMSEMYGSNPYRTLLDLKDVQLKADPKSTTWNRNNDYAFNHLMGQDKVAVNPKLATFFANIRALTSMARLPIIALQSLSDVAYSSGFAKRWGFDYLSSYGKHLNNLFDRVKSDEDRQYLASLMKLSVDHHVGYMGRFTEAENASEIMGKITTSFYKRNLMTAFDRGNKLSLMSIIAKGLRDASDKSWGELSDDTKNMLGKHINENEWNGLRQNNQKGLFTVDNVNKLTNDQLKSIYEGSDKSVPLYQLKNDLYRKVHSMFDVASENAVLTPGAFMRAMMYRGTRPGDWHGEILRMFMQFKGFPLAYMDRVLYQGYKDMGGPKARLIYAAQMMAATLPLTYLSTFLGNIALGKSTNWNPMDWSPSDLLSMINPNVSMASMVFDQHNQNPDMLSSLLFNSPSLKLLSNSLSTAIALAELDPKKAEKDFYNSMASLTPLKTTPIVSPMLNQILGHKSYLEPGQTQIYGQ